MTRAGKTKRRSALTPIGIDIRDAAVYGVQFARSDDQFAVHAAARVPIEANPDTEGRAEAVTAALRELLRGTRFAGRAAVTALPSHKVDTRPVVLPADAGDEDGPAFARALLQEARSCLLYSPEDAVINYIRLGNSGGEEEEHNEVLLLACRKESAFDHLALMKQAGVRVRHVDTAACAAVRVLGKDERIVAVIDLDERHCVISIGKGRDLQFSRTINFGVRDIIEEVSRNLEVDGAVAESMLKHRRISHKVKEPIRHQQVENTGLLTVDCLSSGLFDSCRQALERIAGEVRRSIDYFAGLRSSSRIQTAILAGAVVPKGLEAYIEERLGVPVARARAFNLCPDTDLDMDEDESLFVRAAGLALRDEL